MDLAAIKAAPKQSLVEFAVAATANAQSLLDDAELLSLAGRRGRACSLAEFAVEEVGKACGLMGLGFLPEKLRDQAPVWRLEWHQLKLVGGLLAALIPPGVAAVPKLAGMSAGELAQIMDELKVCVQDAERLKQRGLYVDMDARGCITRPSEVTEAEVSGQLARARMAVSSARALLDPRAPARLASPPAETVEFAQLIADALKGERSTRTPEAAIDIMLKAVTMLRERQAADDEEHACSARWQRGRCRDT
jgi:AbiV family abortive infection protein